ncbi:outer membrane protein OmpU [Paraburkholderia silvatlantica]|uniref:Outer membrane protein OmpU n=1 Tax=Paraburkholderia silvatlantica TaxID=321895 RepID=A0A2V4TP92_9BURK|nr:porin [Paraburkholderia silvatlantica]PYE18405.1 outer membrane protein OmpU [Paraburkholderia silvatlantica]
MKIAKKKISVLVAALISAGAVMPASAQSSVTIYGVLDNGITYLSNNYGHASYQLTSGILSGNRFGFKGVEDLGGGNKAIFQIESIFNVDNGKASSIGTFSRITVVGLSNRYGTLLLGHQYDLERDLLSDFLPNSNDGYSGHVGDYDRLGGERLSNVVKFTSREFHGLTVGGDYGFGNVAGSFGEGASFSVGFRYAYGPLAFGSVYTHENRPTVGEYAMAPYADLGVSTFLGQDVTKITNPVVNLQRTFAGGVSYTIGNVTLAADGSHTEFLGYGQKEIMKVVEFGANSRIRPNLTVAASFQHDWMAGSTWNQTGFGIDYFLSARTDVYLSFDYQRASGAGTLAAIDFVGARSDSQTQIATRIAMRHRF